MLREQKGGLLLGALLLTHALVDQLVYVYPTIGK